MSISLSIHHYRSLSFFSFFLFLVLAPTTRVVATDDETNLTWVHVPHGKFLMGSHVSMQQIAKDLQVNSESPDFFQDEFPQHAVEISKPYLMAATEVTVGQFRRFVAETGYQTQCERDGQGGWGYDASSQRCRGREAKFTWRETGYPQTDRHPVVNVTWEDCRAFCRWLSTKENRIVRLPTEAEWEYACRAKTSTYFASGNDARQILNEARILVHDKKSARLALEDLPIANKSSTAFPVPVGTYSPNSFGLFDMHGNVWEWTSDWYEEDYYQRSTSVDPPGPIQGQVKVQRGGSWSTLPWRARTSFRHWSVPDSRCLNLGFRVVGEYSPLELDAYEREQPLRLLFVGDIMLDGGPGNYISSGKDPFEACSSLLHDSDFTIGNLECVLGHGGRQLDKAYTFRAAHGSPPVLKRYFHALSLANNHSYDYGSDGLAECLQLLKQFDIGYFGAGANIELARSGLLLEKRGRKVMLLGYNEFRAQEYQATDDRVGNTPLVDDWVIEDIQRAKTISGADIVIPFVHWGEEMVSMPSEVQRDRARRWIEAGASAIIGAHPHVTQTIDTYRGAPIVYSLGNFVFDYFPVDPPQWTGWAVRLTIPRQGPIDLDTIALELDMIGLPHPAATE